MCFLGLGRGTHINSDMCFPCKRIHIISDMCFPGRGTHITSDMHFLGRGTHITRDMCLLKRGTYNTSAMCSRVSFPSRGSVVIGVPLLGKHISVRICVC